MEINIDYLRTAFFTFDEAVPYALKDGHTIKIKPVKLIDSILFMSSYGILDIDKNKDGNVETIQMSYLKYLDTNVFVTQEAKQQMINICILCLNCTIPIILYDDNKKAFLYNLDKNGEEIWKMSAKEFDEIRKIILYQNMPNYDGSYINPELKQNMREMDELKSKGVSIPNMERRMAIISAHTGITKKEQMDMTLRSHTMLFEEVVGEVDYMAMKAIACYAGKNEEVQWIYKKLKNKYEDYITSVEEYNKSMGGDGSVKQSSAQSNEAYASQYMNFIGG